MFPITSKVKIAAGIAAGALALGGAGAYAANAGNTVNTFSFTNSGTITSSNGSQTLKLVSTKSGQTLQFPTTPFKNEGQCTSWFAKNKTLALAPTSGTTVNKNFHGKLVSGAQKFCATYAKTDTTGDTAETETSDTTQTSTTETDSSDSADLQSGASNSGHGHGHGHGAD